MVLGGLQASMAEVEGNELTADLQSIKGFPAISSSRPSNRC